MDFRIKTRHMYMYSLTLIILEKFWLTTLAGVWGHLLRYRTQKKEQAWAFVVRAWDIHGS